MDASALQLGPNLALAGLMVGLTTLLHFFGLMALTRLMSRAHVRLRTHAGRVRQAGMILIVVFGVFALHTLQIWLYAAVYRLLGELRTFEEALYFSTTTFASVGFGDVVLSPKWRVFSAIEGANGVILIAWSTAFLLTVTSRLNVFEHKWLERGVGSTGRRNTRVKSLGWGLEVQRFPRPLVELTCNLVQLGL